MWTLNIFNIYIFVKYPSATYVNFLILSHKKQEKFQKFEKPKKKKKKI